MSGGMTPPEACCGFQTTAGFITGTSMGDIGGKRGVTLPPLSPAPASGAGQVTMPGLTQSFAPAHQRAPTQGPPYRGFVRVIVGAAQRGRPSLSLRTQNSEGHPLPRGGVRVLRGGRLWDVGMFSN